MRFKPKAIANYFLDLAEMDNEKIQPLKMQKLVYFAHGWYMAFMGDPIKPLLDEYVEAWQYGPVIPDLYHAFKSFGSNPITGRAVSWYFDRSTARPVVPHIESA